MRRRSKLALTVSVMLSVSAVLVGVAATRFMTLDLQVTVEHKEQRVVRGVMHVHTTLSHDAKQTLSELTRDAKASTITLPKRSGLRT